MKRFTLFLSALAFAASNQATLAQHQQPIALAEAVSAFNDRAGENPIGKHQPALTPDAIIAAIRWAMIDRDKLLVSDDTFHQLGEITRTRVLPKNFDLEVLTGYEPNDQATFDVWSVRLRIPGGTFPGGTTCITIQEKMVGSRLIGEHERQVIHEWRKKEQERGGIGSLERGDWMQNFRKARAEAAALDAKEN